MDLGLAGKRALVTASGRGLGRHIARLLADEGVTVAVCARTARDVEAVVDELGGQSRGHFGRVCDLAAHGAPTRFARELQDAFGAPDIVVHNLGGTLAIKDALCPVEDWQRVWRVNFEVAAELNRVLVPTMQDRKWGRVVHIGSAAGLENSGPVSYCVAKAALTAYTRSLGRVLAPDRVVVSTVLPGALLTEGGSWERAMVERPEYVARYIAERCPRGSFGTAAEVAPMVVFLCSDLAAFCEGSIVPIDGGQSRHFFGTPVE
jgi:NAD(P)-dependent dehydrogenase (short-subunit alcohol dehydrogenase family)